MCCCVFFYVYNELGFLEVFVFYVCCCCLCWFVGCVVVGVCLGCVGY